MPGKHAAYVVAISSYCSFVLFMCISIIGARLALITALVSILVVCAVLAVFSVMKKEFPRFLLVERAAFPIALSGAMITPFLDSTIIAIAVTFVSMLGMSAFMTSHWNLMVKWSRRFNLQAIHHYAYGTYTLSGGFSLGMILNLIIHQFALPVTTSTTVICLVFLVCILTLSALLPFDSENVFNSFERGVARIRNVEGTWKSVMSGIVGEYLLTPREEDVLLFLSLGRSIKYISSKLCISEHTTKTHVYHIYKKLNINGLQELIDLVDHEMQEVKKKKAPS